MGDLLKIRQLSIRLEDATTAERLEALEDLQKLSRLHPLMVCQEALPRLLQVLQDRAGRASQSTSHTPLWEQTAAAVVLEGCLLWAQREVMEKEVHSKRGCCSQPV